MTVGILPQGTELRDPLGNRWLVKAVFAGPLRGKIAEDLHVVTPVYELVPIEAIDDQTQVKRLFDSPRWPKGGVS